MYILHHHIQRCRKCGAPEHWSCLYLAVPKGTGVELQPFTSTLPPDAVVHKKDPIHTEVSMCLECYFYDDAAAARGRDAYIRFEETRRRKREQAGAQSAPRVPARPPTLDELA